MQRKAEDDARQLLENTALFSTLSAEERERLSAHAHIQRFAAGETIFQMGSPGIGMLAILSGDVRISAPSDTGKEIVLTVLRVGDVFGELTLRDGKERSADAVALSPCRIATLARRDILPLLRQHPDLCLKLLQVVCDRLRKTTTQFEDAIFLPLAARLAKTLLSVASRRVSADQRAGMHVRLSQRDLGAMVGATRESVNKCLSEWQRQNILHMDRGVIVIADPAALQELARASPEHPPQRSAGR